MPENNVRLARSDSILTRNKDRKIDMDRDGGRQREGHFPGLCTGREGGGINVHRFIAEHYTRSFIRDELQLPVLFTRNGIEFYTVGIPPRGGRIFHRD